MIVKRENIINCLDLKGQHQQVKSEIFVAFEKVYEITAFSGGSFVKEFENSFAEYSECNYTVGVNNGTSAIQLALLALGIGNGDEVIIPANTFIATAWGVTHVGAIPVFVDCDPNTWEIDATKIEEKITKKTKAIIGVHLYGMPFDIDAVHSICKKHNLFLVEDAAQAQGAKYKKKSIGSFGEMACFSFYPGKNLGACGEAGGITTNNEKYVAKLQSLRNHGCVTRYYHDEIGFNMRMGGLEGASLSIKLKYLDGWNNKRKEIAKRYQNEIVNTKIKLQRQPENTDSVYHLFVVTTDEKDKFVEYLNHWNISPGFHYPVPCHMQKAYSHLNYKEGDFPHSEYLAAHCVSLPMYAELLEDEVTYVIDVINNY
jgi:dTDP-4-amino-4,6-dideoxygalactose transaminase